MKQLTVLMLICCSMMSYANDLNTTNSIKLLTVNGQPQNQLHTTTDIGSGDVILGLQYEELFEVSVEEHHIIRSSVFYLKFDSDPSQDYVISTPHINEIEAKQFAIKPAFILTDAKGHKVDYKLWSRTDLLHKLMEDH